MAIKTITVNGEELDLNRVKGVKGATETDYREGLISLSAADVGATDATAVETAKTEAIAEAKAYTDTECAKKSDADHTHPIPATVVTGVITGETLALTITAYGMGMGMGIIQNVTCNGRHISTVTVNGIMVFGNAADIAVHTLVKLDSVVSNGNNPAGYSDQQRRYTITLTTTPKASIDWQWRTRPDSGHSNRTIYTIAGDHSFTYDLWDDWDYFLYLYYKTTGDWQLAIGNIWIPRYDKEWDTTLAGVTIRKIVV